MPRGQETRERILTEALRLFGTRGYARVSIEEIAEAAGVTKGAVYHWFADKDDLGRALQHDLYERLSSVALRALDPDRDAIANMRRTFETYIDALGSFEEARFFLRDAWVIPALDEAGRQDHDDGVELVRGVIASAVARGEIVPLDPDALARVLMGAWAEATLHVLRTGDRAATVAVVEQLLESLRPVTERTQ
ncbi:MAG: TetR/AcrR family transcriptional regulator [Acidimicrobiia bacterium]|jgi:AcrR family transcriptional regulator